LGWIFGFIFVLFFKKNKTKKKLDIDFFTKQVNLIFFLSQTVSTDGKSDFHCNQNINLLIFFHRLCISRDKASCHIWDIKQALSFYLKRIKSSVVLPVPVPCSKPGSLCADLLCK